MSTIDDYYAARTDVAPFAIGDPDILEEFTFTDYSSIAAFITANPNWSQGGTGSTIDPVKGLVTVSGGSIRTTSWPHAAALAAAGEGSVYIEAERLGVSYNETDIPSGFIQSTGRTDGAGGSYASQAYLISMTASPFTFRTLVFRDPGTTGAGNFKMTTITPSGTINPVNGVNSQRLSDVTDDEHTFVKVLITWKGLTLQIIIDGVVASSTTLGEPMTDATNFSDM
ncbi:MAG TPA: hypothetical protein ENJ35_04160, partial [Gammaproteobacteria bacterium]|nr:hypothetical protein [Gammaproteobacteria bacterium]